MYTVFPYLLEQDGANVDLEIEQEKAKKKKDIDLVQDLEEIELQIAKDVQNKNPLVRQSSFITPDHLLAHNNHY